LSGDCSFRLSLTLKIEKVELSAVPLDESLMR